MVHKTKGKIFKILYRWSCFKRNEMFEEERNEAQTHPKLLAFAFTSYNNESFFKSLDHPAYSFF